MLEYTALGGSWLLAAIPHHSHADRKWANGRRTQVDKLDKALDEAPAKGWTVGRH